MTKRKKKKRKKGKRKEKVIKGKAEKKADFDFFFFFLKKGDYIFLKKIKELKSHAIFGYSCARNLIRR